MKYVPKKYYIKTLGCIANLVDSNTISGILDVLGFEEYKPNQKYKNEKEELLAILPKIDLFIINSCSIRQKSEDKVYGLGRIFEQIKKSNKKIPKIILSGCMVGSVTGDRPRYDFDILKKKTSWVDLYINPSQVYELPDLLNTINLSDVNRRVNDNFVVKQNSGDRAYINISYGCDNFCSYCVVPYSRGEEKHRSENDILKDMASLISRGYKNITLCGQNVNSWGLSKEKKFKIRSGSKQKLPFANLLRKAVQLEGLEKIDFISSNPFDFTEDLIDAIKSPKISNYFHIAVQSGNDDILKKMNRRHTVEQFESIITKILQARPDAVFGTDLIVGFPGETREQFMDTVRLIKKIKFNVAFISIYSSRLGTYAQRFLSDDVSLDEKRYRHKYLTGVWKKTKKK